MSVSIGIHLHDGEHGDVRVESYDDPEPFITVSVGELTIFVSPDGHGAARRLAQALLTATNPDE